MFRRIIVRSIIVAASTGIIAGLAPTGALADDGGIDESSKKVVKTEVIDNSHWSGTREVYSDGTSSSTEIEKPVQTLDYDPREAAPPDSPQGVSAQSTTKKSSGYTGTVTKCTAIPNKKGWKRRVGCRVRSEKWTEVDGAFKADYSVKSGAGRIDKVYAPEVSSMFGVICDSKQVKITRKKNSGKTPATARLSANCSFLKIGGSYTAWMDLNVLGHAWVVDKGNYKE